MRGDRVGTDDIEAPDDEGAATTAALPAWITPSLIRETIRVWQPFYRESLTPEEASTILQNAGRLFGLLSRG